MFQYKIRKTLDDQSRKDLSAYDPVISHLLYHRNQRTNLSAQKFLNPNYETDTHDPFILKDAQKSAKKIIDYIKSSKKIAIYADYDADGIPGASALSYFFKAINYSNYIVYIPHRHDEGFGLNDDAVIELRDQGVELIITIDCGITDYVAVEKANELGMIVIITDHHEPPEKLPNAFAIIDHKQKDCSYPDKNLCGSGVIFKLINAILKIDRFGLVIGWEKWLLDLVGIATLSDMVPLQGENRVFAYYGLMVLRKTRRLGIIELFKKLKIDLKNVAEDDIGFMLTPRINAASRMGVPKDAYELLIASDQEVAKYYSEHLNKINDQRKGVVASIVKDVNKTIRERYEVMPSVIVLGNPEWKPSLLGLVANSCSEEFGRPVFLWGRDGGNIIKGSCRAPKGFSLVNIMKKSPPETFIQFGGHHQSGGFSVANEEVYFLENRLIKSFENIHVENELESDEKDYIDLEISLDEVNEDFVEKIIQLGPFGVGNPKPVFITKNILPINIKKFGKNNDHIELKFKIKNKDIPAISFFGGNSKWSDQVSLSKKIDLIYSVEKSYFRGRPEIRLRIIDLNVY